MALALRTLFCIDNVNVALEADRRVGTLELTCPTNGALRSDDLVSHAFRLLSSDAIGDPFQMPCQGQARSMMGNLPNCAVPGLRPCCICDSNGPLQFQAIRALGPYSDTQSRLGRCELRSVCLAWQRGAKRRSTIPKPAARLKAPCRRTSAPDLGKPPVTSPDWRLCPSRAHGCNVNSAD
jgi:hypothetical protein